MTSYVKCDDRYDCRALQPNVIERAEGRKRERKKVKGRRRENSFFESRQKFLVFHCFAYGRPCLVWSVDGPFERQRHRLEQLCGRTLWCGRRHSWNSEKYARNANRRWPDKLKKNHKKMILTRTAFVHPPGLLGAVVFILSAIATNDFHLMSFSHLEMAQYLRTHLLTSHWMGATHVKVNRKWN